MNSFSYSLSEIAEIVGGEVRMEAPEEAQVNQVEYDTRQIYRSEGTLFVALKSDHRDGHRFLADALRQGVTNFLISDVRIRFSGVNLLYVEDTLVALQKLAAHHRDQFTGTVVAIGGSNGKTIVKEWLASVLEPKFSLIKSPKSFNSQLGVALSLLQLQPGADLALIEAGISEVGEMERLAQMIRPQYGIFTHFGDAHAEGFESRGQKLEEKLKLFSGCEAIWVGADDEEVIEAMQAAELPIKQVGISPTADLQLKKAFSDPKGWELTLAYQDEELHFSLPLSSPADVENSLLVILSAMELGLDPATIAKGVGQLHPVSMRMELISENPEVTILNDAYNADVASIYNAFALLEKENSHSNKTLILTDIEHQGDRMAEVQLDILEKALNRFGEENIYLIGPVYRELVKSQPLPKAFSTTEQFLSQFDYQLFRSQVVLLKGARKFELEKIIPFLSRRVNATLFRINLNALIRNYRHFREKISVNTKMMAMVKAFAYGAGGWEIARTLEREGLNYLAVAYLSEGIELRSRGIRLPVMVMNPDESGLAQLFRFNLEPEVYSLSFLKRCLEAALQFGQHAVSVHIKIETGMRRLGFAREEIPELIEFLKEHPEIRVISLLSHLADADSPQSDAFSLAQINTFTEICNQLCDALQIRPLRHILNTAGILRFPSAAMDMVRLGIGLYGISPLSEPEEGLEEIGSLVSLITQVHVYPEGSSVGYGRSQFTERESRIATIPIGYADGIPRRLGNGKISFLVNGKLAPTFGRVCMDMLMLDITEIPEAEAGDEVVLIGRQGDAYLSVEDFAKQCDTIAYEVLVGISPRVRRLYVKE